MKKPESHGNQIPWFSTLYTLIWKEVTIGPFVISKVEIAVSMKRG